ARPAEFVETGADDAAGGLELAVDQKPHGHRGGMPAARRQAAEDARVRRVLVEMERLRIELGGKRLDAFLVDAQLRRAEGLTDREVFQVECHDEDLAGGTASAGTAPAGARNQAPLLTATAMISPNAASAAACAMKTGRRSPLRRSASQPPPAAI